MYCAYVDGVGHGWPDSIKQNMRKIHSKTGIPLKIHQLRRVGFRKVAFPELHLAPRCQNFDLLVKNGFQEI